MSDKSRNGVQVHTKYGNAVGVAIEIQLVQSTHDVLCAEVGGVQGAVTVQLPLNGVRSFTVFVVLYVIQHVLGSIYTIYALRNVKQKALVVTRIDGNEMQAAAVLVLVVIVNQTVFTQSNVLFDLRLESVQLNVFVNSHNVLRLIQKYGFWRKLPTLGEEISALIQLRIR